MDYYQTLNKVVPDVWEELMKLLAHCFNDISNAPMYLSRLLTLKKKAALFDMLIVFKCSAPA